MPPKLRKRKNMTPDLPPTTEITLPPLPPNTKIKILAAPIPPKNPTPNCLWAGFFIPIKNIITPEFIMIDYSRLAMNYEYQISLLLSKITELETENSWLKLTMSRSFISNSLITDPSEAAAKITTERLDHSPTRSPSDSPES